MSLLLDALKKSGSSSPDNSGKDKLSELTLEELPGKPAAPATSPQDTTPPVTPRSAGENLFAAKKPAPTRKLRYNLGIIPTAIIIGLVLATAGSIYVWYEIQPPKAAQYRPPAVASQTPATPPPMRTMPELAMNTDTPRPTESRASKLQEPAAQVKSTPARQPRPAVKSAPASNIRIQLKSENDDTYSTLMSAYNAYQSGDLGTAWQQYRTVLIHDAKNRDALLGMAAIAQQQGKDEVAQQYYRQVLMLDPRDPVALAGMSAFTANTADRESRLKLSLSQSPNSAALQFALGNLYSEQSRWSEAQQAFFSAFRIDPGNALFAFKLATSLDHLGQYKIAVQYYQQALQLDKNGTSGFDRSKTEQRVNQLMAP